ncbi:liprin-beta-2 [Osmerus eperlanus]|uniref:liprin-beta-2 n=1 Tax=Osmerus eperlanus TaxID=29151 RepID=UPI002E110F65
MEYDIDFHKHFAWLKKVNPRSPASKETYQERLLRLEGDKESLVLQVSVLTDQVEAQGLKISDLENCLEEHQLKLNSTEEMLKQELHRRTSLESQKLELLGQVSYLNIQLTNMEGRHAQGVERQHKAEDRRIEELTLLLSQCRQFREISTSRHGNHAPPPASPPAIPVSNQRTPSSSSEEEEQGAMTTALSTDSPSSSLKSESQLSSSSSSPQLRSSLSPHKDPRSKPQPLLLSSSMKPVIDSTLLAHASPEVQQGESRCSTLPVKVSLTEHNGDCEAGDTSEAGETSEASEARETADSPEARETGEASDSQSQRSPATSEDGDSIQRKTEKTGSVPPSDSSPQSSGAESGQRLVGSPEHLKNNRSIRKLWGKLRRTQSGGLQSGGLQSGGLQSGGLQSVDQDQSQFRRGGLRATAGPRLTRSPGSASAVRDVNTPFCQWSRDQVCGWLEDCGLGQYVNLTRQWVENGQTLLSATPQDFEKDMGMKHALHRKKLQLALTSLSSNVVEKSSELDHIWVTRWLDDIGLPQYKDQFHEGRVDGRMIQYLTVNDLLTLKVTSQLHHLSIKCAIHVLHVNKFNPHCLRRRPGEEKQPPPSEVVQWSNHRVMEWLRAVELAEYAPNLRGSGVHGGLIILEPRFSSETLALLLNIPPQKTLLRRHLASAFSLLVGPQASLEKREYANATGHVPLTTTAKVKPKKLGFNHFSHLRKRRPDETEDYICPIDTGALVVPNGVSPRPYAGLRGLNPILDRDTDAMQEQCRETTL